MSWELIIALVILGIGAVAASFFIYQKIKDYSTKAIMLKTIASFLFVILGVYCSFVRSFNSLTLFMVIGLALGMLGDVFLGFKHVYKNESKLFVKAGFVCFSLGHIFYVSGMFTSFFKDQSFLYILLPLVVAAILGSILLIIEKPLNLHYGSMKKIIFIYGFLLFSTPCSALSLAIMTHFEVVTLVMLTAAGFLFATSDILLCDTYFGENKDTTLNNLVNSITYYLAQYAIAFSIFFL